MGVSSGSGYAPGIPGHSYDPNAEARPYRVRGIYPRAGLYYHMARQDPIVNSGLIKQALSIAGLPWAFPDPPNPTPDEVARGHLVRGWLRNLRCGWKAAVEATVGGWLEAGFALHELVFNFDPLGRVRLENLKWLESWQVERWLPPKGDWERARITGDNGAVDIPRNKLFRFGRRDCGGTRPEGESALRSLIYYLEYKRQALLRDAIAQERFGVGTPELTYDRDAVGDEEVDEAEEILKRLVVGEQGYVMWPTGFELKMFHGGSVKPSVAEPTQLVNEHISRQLDDQLATLGTSQFGARAVGSEMRKATDQVLEGLVGLLCEAVEQQVIRQIYLRNAWDPGRAIRCTVGGFEDLDKLRVLAEFVRQPEFQWTPEDLAAVRMKVLRDFGVGVEEVT
ncbi:MAG: phage portal protein family protein [Planctomycetota bacterium]|jgi:hypothetical protein